jgi:hypothetical protein
MSRTAAAPYGLQGARVRGGNGARPRDGQRARVYAWEDRHVAPHDPSVIGFAQAQGIVDSIWAESGLRYPPLVEPLPRQARSRMADASRLAIRMAGLLDSLAKAGIAVDADARPAFLDRRGK